MRRAAAAAAVLALAGAGLAAGASSAAATTAHCADHTTLEKVELDYETTTVELEPGTVVCYKAGTRVATVTVGDDGMLVSTITNKAGKAMAISYFVIVDGGSPPPAV